MSWRKFREQHASSQPQPTAPTDSDDSDGVFDPLNNRINNKFTYEGLEIEGSSGSDEENKDNEETKNNEGTDDNHEDDTVSGASISMSKKKKKNKNKKKKSADCDFATPGPSGLSGPSGKSGPSGSSGPSGTSGPSGMSAKCRNTCTQMDEIDRSLMEVNELLGAPPPAPPLPEVDVHFEQIRTLLGVQAKYLNVCNELKRLFGPEEPEEIRLRNRTQPHRARVLKRVLVSPTSETTIYNFKKAGLSMSILKVEKDITYFVYDHDSDYQKMHSIFLEKHMSIYLKQNPTIAYLENAKRNMHVEPLLDIADFLFRMDENSMGNELVENVVAYLQFCAHPSFNLTSLKVRLLYDHLENRPFHVSMLKYIYLLTNKACHRTALEIAKMMLNVDPSDPLAVVMVIDTLALRAREHQWLIDAIDFLKKQRQVGLLFNIQYSYALAHFHIASKKNDNLDEADRNLQAAIIAYPGVVVKLYEYANIRSIGVLSHTLFEEDPRARSSEGLSELMMVYAKLTWERWREPKVIDWFMRNVIEATENYDNNIAIKRHSEHLNRLRLELFQVWPIEILRHILVIRSMANLLMETTLQAIDRRNSGWDPLCDRGINRYNYIIPTECPPAMYPGGRNILYRFFTSIIPHSDIDSTFGDQM